MEKENTNELEKKNKRKARQCKVEKEWKPGLRRRQWRAKRPREWAKHSLRRDRLGPCRPSVFCSPMRSGSPFKLTIQRYKETRPF